MGRRNKVKGDELEQEMLAAQENESVEVPYPAVESGDPGDETPVESPKQPEPDPAPAVKPEPKSLALVLLVLQLIGAIPAVIEAAQKLWELIQGIRNRRQKADMRFKFRQMVYGRKEGLRKQRKKTMSVDENEQLGDEIGKMTEQVQAILQQEFGG